MAGANIDPPASAPVFRLHWFQERDVTRIFAAWRAEDARRVVYVLPTGAGKTVVAAMVAKRERGPVLFVAHRRELVRQAAERLVEVGVPRAQVGTIMSEADTNTDARVLVASMQTLAQRRLRPPASVVIVDEAHHATAPGYRRLFDRYPDARILGLTATPTRLDGEGLVGIFDRMVIGEMPSRLIEKHVIVPPVVFAAARLPDLSHVRQLAKDYHTGDLDPLYQRPEAIGDVIDHWNVQGRGRLTVVFAVSIAHARLLREAFAIAGAEFAHVDGGTPHAEREQIVRAMLGRQIAGVTNCGVFTEGVDIPALECAVLARPTLSLTLYLQMCGRLSRPYGERAPVVLDHGGNVVRHGLPHDDREWSFYGVRKAFARGSSGPLQRCSGCGRVLACVYDVCGCGRRLSKASISDLIDGVVPSGRDATQTRCWGYAGHTCRVRMPRGRLSPSAFRARGGAPWRCASCAKEHQRAQDRLVVHRRASKEDSS